MQQGGFWKFGFPKCLSPLSSLSVINSDWKLQCLFECTFFLVADLISWVASAVSHILHVWITTWDTAILLSYLAFVVRQHLGRVHTDWLPGAPSKVLPSSCQLLPSLFHEEENSHWERRQALCRGASSLTSYGPPASLRASQTQKNPGMPTACHSPAPSIQAHKAIERRSYKKG